jgi:hypothetical protein
MRLSKVAGLLAGILISASPAVGQVNIFKSEFNTDGDLEGWVDAGGFIKEFLYDGVTFNGEEEVNGGAYRGKAIGIDPKMSKAVSISKDLAKEVVVRLRQSQNNGATWDTAGSLANNGVLLALGQISPSPLVVLGGGDTTEFTEVADETVAGDGWTLLTYPLVGKLSTDITNIRFDPSGFSTGESFEVDYIRVVAVDDPPAPVLELDPPSPVNGSLVLDKEWDWDVNGSLDGWATTNFTVTLPGGVSGSVVTGASTSGDAIFQSPLFTTGVPASGEMVIEIGVITDTGGATTGEFFWQDDNGNFAAARRVAIPALPADGQPHVIRIHFTGDIVGTLDRIRYDPSQATGIISKIDYVRIYVDPAPDIEVKQGSGTIANGGSKNFGTVDIGVPTSLNFTINNLGTADLILDGSPLVAVGGTDAADFTVTSQPSSPVAASDSTSFTVEFSPSGRGSRSATLTIASNDADEDPYVINVSGTGGPAVDHLWDGGGADGNFSTAANWSGAAPTTLTGKKFGFIALTSPQQSTANVDLAGNSYQFIFFPDAAPMTITGDALQWVDNGSANERTVINFSSNPQTFSSEVRQFWNTGSTNRTWDAFHPDGTLEFNSVILRGDSTDKTALTWTLTGAGDGRITGNVGAGSWIAGDSVDLIKTGSGTWDLQGNLPGVMSSLAVNEGTLLLGGSNSAAVSVASGGTLGGSGTVGGAITVDAGGTLAPGGSVGSLSAAAGATINGTLVVEIDGATIDLLAVTGTLDVSSASIDFSVLGAPIQASYTLATATTITGAPAVTNVPAGYEVNVGPISITLDALTAYDNWAAGFAGFVDTAPGANPDNDSFTNLQEFAFGTNPTVSDSGPLAYVAGGAVTTPGQQIAQNVAASGVDFRAVFCRRKDWQAAGLTYTVQFSVDDFTSWVNSDNTGLEVLTGDDTANPGDIEVVSVPYPLFIPYTRNGVPGFEKPKFFRVGVSQGN